MLGSVMRLLRIWPLPVAVSSCLGIRCFLVCLAGLVPPLANEWADRNVEIPNWEVLDSTAYPEPGFIVAFPNPRGSGHVGIVDYDGWTINARELAVSRYGLKMLDSKCVYRKPIVQSEENR